MTLVQPVSESGLRGTITKTSTQPELARESNHKSPSIVTSIDYTHPTIQRREFTSPATQSSPTPPLVHASSSSLSTVSTIDRSHPTTAMNSQYSTSNDMTSNLHLLSKVIEDSGDKALVHRTLTCPKRISLPSSPRIHTKMELSSDESPSSCSNTKIVRVAKSWKKRAIIAMEKETPSSPNKTIHHNPAINDNNDQVETTRSTPTMNNDDDKDIDHPEHSESITSATTSVMTPLPFNFQPGPYDVLCGRGRACKDAPGNKAYRIMIMNQLHVYAEAPTKLAKGLIISNIMEQIQQQCYAYHGSTKVGGFIKYQNGRWYDVGEFLAREKTSQCFRDALAAQYSSSAQSKYLRRRASRELSNADSTTSNEHVQDDNASNTDHRHHLNQIDDANRTIRTSHPHRVVTATEVCIFTYSYCSFCSPFQ
jgi:hypothetical protein